MSRTSRRSVAVLGVLHCVSLVALACGDDDFASDATETTTTSAVAPDTPAIMAAAAYQLVTVDNTFESGTNPFSTFVLVDRTKAGEDSGDDPSDRGDRPLADSEISAIEQVLAPLGELVRISDAEQYRNTELTPTSQGVAIIELGEPEVDGNAALIPVAMWCGNVCGTFFTYSLRRDDAGQWVIDGIDGPIGVS